jgi:ATP-dependent exoDNAse (exonuclease V) beta subunit
MSRLAQIKASAGSGKTYHLTSRFLELLRTASAESRGLACRAGTGGIHAWPEILAITFTNKAAAEMKARVIGALKSRALELPASTPADAWQPRTAAMVLERILRRYHRLNIRTIDSLLHQLTTIFALELGINPDFELSFDVAELFRPLYERFVAEAAAGGAARRLFLDAVHGLLAQGETKGFWLAEGVEERFMAVFGTLLTQAGEISCDPRPLEAKAAAAHAGFRRATEQLVAAMTATGLAMDKRFATFLENCLACALPEPPPASAYAAKPSLADCVLARCKPLVDGSHEDLFQSFVARLLAYREAAALAKGAVQLAPAVAICQELISRAPEHRAEAGLLLGLTMAPTVAGLLERGMAVPEAYCRLGTRLSHLLIDEFQDTSREQWQALAPLAEECLAKGGSLYWVGDVKQAIYAWRGGDSKLFDAILDEPPVSLFAEGEVRRELDSNWRSLPAVVEFNNDVFAPLGEPGTAADSASRLLGKDPPQWAVDELAATIGQGFSAARQEVCAKNRAKSGYVRFEKLPGGTVDTLVETTREAFLALMNDGLLPRRAPGEIAVLVRSHKDAGLICDWLVEAGVPVVTDASLLLARHPLVRELLALLSFLDYPLDSLSLLTFATGRGLFLAESGLDAARVLDWFAGRPTGAVYKDFAAAFPGPWERLVAPFFSQAGLMTPYDLVWEIVRTYRILERHPGDELYVRRLLELAFLAEERGKLSLSAFLDFWENEAGEEKVPLPEGLGAVRILTVHKAKGLEFPVVVVPFHHWSVREDPSPTPVTVEGKTLLVPRRKDMGRPYYAWKNQQLFEQLTMLYVAWTRAAEELYGFLPDGDPGRGRMPVLGAVAGLLEESFGRERVIERGTRPEPPMAPRAAAAAPPGRHLELPPGELTPTALMDWLPRLNIFRHSLADLNPGEKMRGEVAHRALELFLPGAKPGDDPTGTAARAARLALDDFPAFAPLASGFTDWFAASARWLMTDPRLAAALTHGRREVAVLDAAGKPLRLDLLAETADGLLVVDYKTGRPDPENETQVRTYLHLARDLAKPGQEVTGLLVYLDLREIREVVLDGHGGRP